MKRKEELEGYNGEMQVSCRCVQDCSQLQATAWKDIKEIDISIFAKSWKYDSSIWFRLRFLWNVLRGNIWTDHICLDYNDAQKLGKFLLNKSQENEVPN